MDITLHVNYISNTHVIRAVVLPTPFLSMSQKETRAPRTSIPANIRPLPLSVACLGTGNSSPRPRPHFNEMKYLPPPRQKKRGKKKPKRGDQRRQTTCLNMVHQQNFPQSNGPCQSCIFHSGYRDLVVAHLLAFLLMETDSDAG